MQRTVRELSQRTDSCVYKFPINNQLSHSRSLFPLSLSLTLTQISELFVRRKADQMAAPAIAVQIDRFTTISLLIYFSLLLLHFSFACFSFFYSLYSSLYFTLYISFFLTFFCILIYTIIFYSHLTDSLLLMIFFLTSSRMITCPIAASLLCISFHTSYLHVVVHVIAVVLIVPVVVLINLSSISFYLRNL